MVVLGCASGSTDWKMYNAAYWLELTARVEPTNSAMTSLQGSFNVETLRELLFRNM